MEQEAIGRNFAIRPKEARIFHASAKHQYDDTWFYRNPLYGTKPLDADTRGFMRSIEKYLTNVERAGDLERAKMFITSPMGALILHAVGILPVERFQAVVERSSGYFDISGSGLAENMPIRVAQHPLESFMVADERGFPVTNW